jgi:hypothetical protein
VLPHEEVALAEADLVAASDHRPVWVDLELDPARVGARGPGPGEEAVSEEAVSEEAVSEAVVVEAERRAGLDG